MYLNIYFQSSFLIIFAPTALYKGVYDALKEEIYDSSVAVLEPGGANIVNIIGKKEKIA
jgi:hypothetical protein